MIPPGFTEFSFTAKGITHRVFRKGAGPAVLVMHELPGMVPQCTALGEAIADHGFLVHLTLFYGEPGDRRAWLRPSFLTGISREIYLLSKWSKKK